MSIQAILTHTVTTTLTFAGIPSEETRKVLTEHGFQFDRRSKQWYLHVPSSGVVTEEQVVRDIGIAA